MSNTNDDETMSSGPELPGIADGSSDALDGRTEGLINQASPEGGTVVSDETGPEGGINEVASSDSGQVAPGSEESKP